MQSDWQHAIWGLTKLQELWIDSAAAAAAEEPTYNFASMHKGALLAVLSRLSALRLFTVLGIRSGTAATTAISYS